MLLYNFIASLYFLLLTLFILSSFLSGVRPFGVSLLVAGFQETPSLYQVDPSGSYFAWKAAAIGKNMVNSKTFLEKRWNESMELEDGMEMFLFVLFILFLWHLLYTFFITLLLLCYPLAIHTAILTLKEASEGNLSADSLEIGVASIQPVKNRGIFFKFNSQDGGVDSVGVFRVLNDSQVNDYLANI